MGKDTTTMEQELQSEQGVIVPKGMKFVGQALASNGKQLDILTDKPMDAKTIQDQSWRVVNEQVTAEIVNEIRGIRTDELIYNYPKSTTKGGRTHWRACDRMPGGCSMNKKNMAHVHIVDVGIKGALAAMAAYGGLDVRPAERPTTIEELGEFWWVVEMVAIDKWRDNQTSQWYYEKAYQRYGKEIVLAEHAMHIVQSKAKRNMILALLPGHLRLMWINDYLNGRKPFDPERAIEIGRIPPELPATKQETKPKKKLPAKKKPEKKEPKPRKTTSPTGTSFEDVVAQVADTLGLEKEQILAFCDAQYPHKAASMINLVQAVRPRATVVAFMEIKNHILLLA